MKINKIIIENFKSIEKIEFDIKKYGESYTTMFLGINESGKSNILQAMSYLNTPDGEFDYDVIHNQKDESDGDIDIFFYLNFETDICVKEVRKKIENGSLLNFEVIDLIKNVYLRSGEKKFIENFDFEIKNLTEGLFIKKEKKENVNIKPVVITEFTLSKSKNDDEYEVLSIDLFNQYFSGIIYNLAKINEPKVSFWKPSDEYLITDVDLNKFKDDIDSNIPLKNIFALAGFKKSENIKNEINKIHNFQLKSKLKSLLSNKTTEYVNEIWKHKIKIDIDISDSGVCHVNIQDDGKKNQHNFYRMASRSEGFKQFISLILSLSIETKKLEIKNKLILIDEPETHLHPSGIRDLKKELLEIGKNNYLFVSTHSPFLVDRDNKERNIIIRKNDSALTVKKEIKSEEDIRDDEVLDEAFGINVYRDLLINHRILVEGASDKIILQKSFVFKDYKFGITNGNGSNIVQVASKLNSDDIKVLVIVDDDLDGKKYKQQILKIGGVYSANNIFTLRDLVGGIKNDATIEDLLGKSYIQQKFNDFYESKFSETCNYVFDDSPFVKQIKIYLQQNNKFDDQVLEDFKKNVSDNFNPSKTGFNRDFPLLNSLAEEINNKLSLI